MIEVKLSFLWNKLRNDNINLLWIFSYISRFSSLNKEKNAIVVLDDYGGINQTGVKKAINKIGLKKSACIETSSGQLIYINFNKY